EQFNVPVVLDFLAHLLVLIVVYLVRGQPPFKLHEIVKRHWYPPYQSDRCVVIPYHCLVIVAYQSHATLCPGSWIPVFRYLALSLSLSLSLPTHADRLFDQCFRRIGTSFRTPQQNNSAHSDDGSPPLAKASCHPRRSAVAPLVTRAS